MYESQEKTYFDIHSNLNRVNLSDINMPGMSGMSTKITITHNEDSVKN